MSSAFLYNYLKLKRQELSKVHTFARLILNIL